MKNILKNLVLCAFVTAPFALTGCAPECVDFADCADKAKAEKKEFTCEAGVCKAGSPFPDAGSGGGGGTTGGGGGTTGGGGGTTGGGGGTTGGGGGTTGGGGGTTGGGGGTTGGGGGTIDDGGMDDAGTGGGGGTTGGGGGTTGGGGGTTGGGGGTTTDAGTIDEQITAVRTAADTITDGGAVGLTISGALVTYLKPLSADAGTSDPAGFFIQGTQNGPALFVAIDPSLVAGGPFVVGDLVDINVLTVTKTTGIRMIVAVTSATKSSSGNPVSGLTAAIDAVDFLAAGQLDLFESRLISTAGTVLNEPVVVGSGYKGVNISTTGTPDAGTNLRMRIPAVLMEAQFFGPGCTFSLTGTPMWRFNAAAQPSAWLQSELTNVVCPGPSPIAANATSATAVTVNFSRDLAVGTVTQPAFTISSSGGPLAVSAASSSGARGVSLTTAAQTGGTVYTVTVANTVTDMRGTAVPGTANTTTFTGAAGPVCMPGVVISAVFGGNSGTNPFNQDFVELHNRTAAPISLAGWSIQYASATGTSWAVNALTGSIAAGGYHLVGLASSAGGTAIPTPDSAPASPSNLSGTNGKIALSNSTTALTGACPTTNAAVVDFFGYGTADCSEGTVHPALTGTTGTTRNTLACADTNVNSADFTAGTPPVPKNAASTANTCTCP